MRLRSRTRMDSWIGVPSKPNSSRRRRSMNRRYAGSRKPVVKSTKRGGLDETCVAKRMRGCLPPRRGWGCAATSWPRKAFKRPVGIRVSHPVRAVSRALVIRFVCHEVFADRLMRGAHEIWKSSRSISALRAD